MFGGVFDPQGPVALQERDLIITAVLLMLLVAIPMLILLYSFAWKYRADKKGKKGTYAPEHVGSPAKLLLWWAIPSAIIATIAVMNWQSTHALDPYKPIVSAKPAIEVQVVALPWKWLFIYPAQGIATVNYLEFPEQTPVHFVLTADAPMSSFWIPELGSQIYAMSAMQTQLYLEASSTGTYDGKDTEINGDGYSGMTFKAVSVAPDDFDAWVGSVRHSPAALTKDVYRVLAEPSQYVPPVFYATVDPDLFTTILTKDAPTSTGVGNPPAMPGMNP